MGQDVGCYVGFGFKWNCFETTDERLRAFFKNHKDKLLECVSQDVADFVTSDDFSVETLIVDYEYCCDADYGYSSNYAMNMVANIMSKETGIRFSSVNHDGENDTIMFEPYYPWKLTEAERNLTSGNVLRDILKKYCNELGITSEIGTHHVEWCD